MVPGGRGRSVDAGVLTAIAQACRDDERLRFGYTARERQRESRHVEPHRLVSLGRRWYLVAYDLDRQDWRSFRLDRLADPAPTGARFRPRELPGGDAAAFLKDSLASMPTRYDVLVRIRAPAERVRRVVGRWGTVDDGDGSACTLAMSVDSLDWPVMVLGSLGAEFAVIRPPELHERVGEIAERFARASA